MVLRGYFPTGLRTRPHNSVDRFPAYVAALVIFEAWSASHTANPGGRGVGGSGEVFSHR